MTGQIITNEYSNDEYMDGQIEDMKTGIVEFINKLVASFNNKVEGHRGTDPDDNSFYFSRSRSENNIYEETD